MPMNNARLKKKGRNHPNILILSFNSCQAVMPNLYYFCVILKMICIFFYLGI